MEAGFTCRQRGDVNKPREARWRSLHPLHPMPASPPTRRASAVFSLRRSALRMSGGGSLIDSVSRNGERRSPARRRRKRLFRSVSVPLAIRTPAAVAGDVGWLYEVACLCNRQDIEVEAALARIAELLASAMPDQASSCRIEFMGSCYWSPGYAAHEARAERPLTIPGPQVGSITLSTSSSEAIAQVQTSFDAAAGFVAEMLARRSTASGSTSRSEELKRRQSILEQTARLAKMGAWEFDDPFGKPSRGRTRCARSPAGAPAILRASRRWLRHYATRSTMRSAAGEPISRELSSVSREGRRRWLQAIGEVEYPRCAAGQGHRARPRHQRRARDAEPFGQHGESGRA